MIKFWSVFKISFEQEFVYKVNLVVTRLRNILQILVFYFLWNAALSNGNETLFGYDKSKILTYALLLIVVRAVALSSRSADVAGQIASGDISNHLLKPVNFFKYWLVRDISNKFINISFAIVEIGFLFYLLNPPLFWQTNPLYILFFLIALLISMFIFFNILMITSLVPFWMPEMAWGAQFLVIAIVVEFLSGAIFPLDVFPETILRALQLTPFPYLIYVPIKIYLGSFTPQLILQNLLIGTIWCLLLWYATNYVWQRGLRVYQAYGR